MGFRKESDFLGSVNVPSEAYYGVFTVRAGKNFQISGIKLSENREFIRALGMAKVAAARANMKLGLLDRKIGKTIEKAGLEVAAGKHDREFVLDVFTAGAGTPFNMCANEVISNRALELMGRKRGDYATIDPNNHANMSQSTNDVIPTVTRLSTLFLAEKTLKEAQGLEAGLRVKAKQFAKIVKSGRTHLQDAVPITLGQEFEAWAEAVERDCEELECGLEGMLEIPLGGTALGTGINTHPKYVKTVASELSKISGYKFVPAKSLAELEQNMNPFVVVSGKLKCLAITLVRIANDLKLLASGPKTAIGEIILPEVEPGSSIMPGKINPSIPEAVEMVGIQVISNDNAVTMASMGGQLDLNMLTPLIAYNLNANCELLANTCKMFSEKCIRGIKADRKRIDEHLANSLTIGTALNPYFGYGKMSALIKKALKEGKSLKQVILEEKLLSESELNRLLSPEKLTKPSLREGKLLKKIRGSKGA
ncbi:Fumarate hydratase class II [Candidatus Gugararchaeum adminiculabundum]|nr:Fumarate hydratase class II [Candidatus Gugararchaeum adminiculabundum]